MAQKLIQPMNNMRVTCTYKHPDYVYGGRKATHYGLDCSDKDRKDFTVWASGKGIVKATGWDDTVGNVVVVVYKDCQLHDGTVRDLTFRYFHFKSIAVKVGQSVTKDTRLGVAGNTPVSKGMGVHLHVEVDKDTDDRYVCWSPTVSKKTGLIRNGVDSTINPLLCLWTKTTHPDYQTFMFDSTGWVDYKPSALPKL